MDRQLCLRSLRSISHAKYVITPPKPSSSYISIISISHCKQRNAYSHTSDSISQRRYTHSKRHVSTVVGIPPNTDIESTTDVATPSDAMSCLPLSTLLRSYLITSISSIPVLLRPSLAAMTLLAHSKSSFLNPDTNPLLKMLLKRTFYVQFCAGENALEVKKTIDGLKSMGYQGVIMGHAKEVVLSKEDEEQLNAGMDAAEQEALNDSEIATWRDNTLKTIELAQEGDFVALKFTGAGRQALQHLKATTACAPKFEAAVHEICQLAEQKNVSLLFDAEQASLQQGIDNWTIYFMKHYNTGKKAVVYGTYQAYAKRTPIVLAQHLAEATKNDFVLGVKLVRGAYLGSDPRHLFWDTIEETHGCYDNLAKCVMERQYSGQLQPVSPQAARFPRVNLVLASHNANSVATARKIRDQQAQTGEERIPMAYGQLMGMADNVSCEIVREARDRKEIEDPKIEIPQAYKYLVWGTMGECMKYLLRRAHENKDAVSRTVDARRALGHEIARRMGLSQ